MRETKLIPIDQIQPNRHQPRSTFPEETIFELAQSIRENGLIQPILVRPLYNGYEIIAGERRYQAAILAGHTEIEAIVDTVDETMLSKLALVENIQREDLSVIDEARAYKTIMEHQGFTQSELASIIGKSQSTIANKLRLFNLNSEIIEALHVGKITERHGRALLTAKPDILMEAFNKIIKQDLSVKESERLIERLNQDNHKPITKAVYTQSEKIAINTVKQAVTMIKKTGTKAQLTQVDSDDAITLTITIAKNKGN